MFKIYSIKQSEKSKATIYLILNQKIFFGNRRKYHAAIDKTKRDRM